MIIDWGPNPTHSDFGMSVILPAVYVMDTGGNVYELTFTGTLQPVGLLIKQPRRVATGTVLPAGLPKRAVSVFPEGWVVLSGAIEQDVIRLLRLTGEVASTGATAQDIAIVRTGSVTPTSALRKHLTTVLVGAMAAVGVAKKLSITFTQGLVTVARAVFRQPQLRALADLISSGSIYTGQRFKTIARTIIATGRRRMSVNVFVTGAAAFVGNAVGLVRPVLEILLHAHNRWLVWLSAQDLGRRFLRALNRSTVHLPAEYDPIIESHSHNRALVSVGADETLIILQGSHDMVVQNFDLWHDTTSRLRFVLSTAEDVTGWTTEFHMRPKTGNTATLTLPGAIYDLDNGIFDVVVTPQDIDAMPFKYYQYTFRRTDVGFETLLTSGTIHFYSAD